MEDRNRNDQNTDDKNMDGKKKALILGGSGALSGALAELAKKEYEVWAVTRGNRPLPKGIHGMKADRDDEDLQQIIQAHISQVDVVFDCICMNAEHANRDWEIFSQMTNRLVVVSTDSVYDPRYKRTPQGEEGVFLDISDESVRDYATEKRRMEVAFERKIKEEPKGLAVTIFRPGHLYGKGLLLGCYPEESRKTDLAERMKAGEILRLVAGGIYLIHPVYVRDLAKTMLSCVDNERTYRRIFCIGGPEAFENRHYYQVLADLLGVELKIEEVALEGYVEAHPEFAGHLNHRIYDLSALRETGVWMPNTSLEEGLKEVL